MAKKIFLLAIMLLMPMHVNAQISCSDEAVFGAMREQINSIVVNQVVEVIEQENRQKDAMIGGLGAFMESAPGGDQIRKERQAKIRERMEPVMRSMKLEFKDVITTPIANNQISCVATVVATSSQYKMHKEDDIEYTIVRTDEGKGKWRITKAPNLL